MPNATTPMFLLSSLSDYYISLKCLITFKLGCSGYMPPEYLLQGQISHQTDIYSLGVIMCEIITGEKMPFVLSSEATSRKFTESKSD